MLAHRHGWTWQQTQQTPCWLAWDLIRDATAYAAKVEQQNQQRGKGR